MRRKEYEAPRKVQAQVIEAPKDSPRGFLGWYDRSVMTVTIIALIVTALCLGQIIFQTATTGEFIQRGVSLKGGVTITIPTDQKNPDLAAALKAELPAAEIEIRILETAGAQNSIIIESDISDTEETDRLIAAAETATGVSRNLFSVDFVGSSLGQSFFREIVIALFVAFLFMSIVVFIYFRIPMPSFIVILCAFSDIVCTMAVVNLLGIKVSTAGIAAFLMLIGYSVDTDILLTTRVLKNKEGSVLERTVNAAKTGLTMTITGLSAIIIVLIFSKSAVLNQIMLILLIGLLFDIFNTWGTNVGLLRLYLKRKQNG